MTFPFLSHWHDLNTSIEIGGFRQWLEEGRGGVVAPLLSFVDQHPHMQPKSVRLVARTLKEIRKYHLDTPESLRYQSVVCHLCGGHARLDNDTSPCPICDGNGVLWKGALTPHFHWLSFATEAFLRLSSHQRTIEVIDWHTSLHT
jgi:hypothetical protein